MDGKDLKPKLTVGFDLTSQSNKQIDENSQQRRTETNHTKSRIRINHSSIQSISPNLVLDNISRAP